MRWAALGTGAILIVVAFLAGSRVADTREGLVYEVVTLLAGLAGVSILLYGLVAPMSQGGRATQTPRAAVPAGERVAGLLVSAILLCGIAASAGPLWALLGGVLLLPMIAGCVYLCVSFARAERRDWRIDFQKLRRGG